MPDQNEMRAAVQTERDFARLRAAQDAPTTALSRMPSWVSEDADFDAFTREVAET